MPSVIEMYRLSVKKKKNKKVDGDVLGLIRMMYPNIEHEPNTSDMLLNRFSKGDKK